ncbi:hypothetical protein CWATWH8502_1293 [Crocosphaera watsonii WH 8502]|uniref:Uncharacterized protein n=5 Tax=Crocosphaera watsonii TaxID=263511 RepID=T2JK31_CROWT|nr:hypothetical protein CWATWH0003_3343 [Crocosphaera watsonii WH 0003]CCQ50051.1 hypothetical protein CWATWH8502_1293 [Crocosphaera watsonii WH 8502]CCQ54492.1 hypothetical protein CWATWH0005_3650 [Crocosphaera watsonii WH 0005]CCQ63973.1 hypothetical protein CWATWH0401_3845 [Crocosphaera watsonii WH 0401]CCQ65615.1 hypothetical protein CWATWH0402_4307 [Crocosphaera watsonii WH 0402]
MITKKTCGEGAKGAESRSYHRALMQPQIFRWGLHPKFLIKI